MKGNGLSIMFSKVKACLCILISLAFIFCYTTIYADAATISKSINSSHIIPVAEDPLIINITIRTNDAYDGTYTTSGTTRTFSRHKHTVTLSSINDSALTSRISLSIYQMQFYTPGTKISCPKTTCTCSFFIGSPIIKVKHDCSVKVTSCRTGSTAHVTGGYILTGGTVPVVNNNTFTGIAN